MYSRLVSGACKRKSLKYAGAVLRTYSVAPQSAGEPILKEIHVPFDPPTAEGQAPDASPEVQEIAERISKLSLLDVVSLNKLLKYKFNLPDFASMGMMVGAASAAQPIDQSSAEPAGKTSFAVKLTSFDEKQKIALIKEVKTLVAGMNLVQAKKFVESLPQTVREDLGQDEAEKLQKQLAAVGGQCTIE